MLNLFQHLGVPLKIQCDSVRCAQGNTPNRHAQRVLVSQRIACPVC